MDKRKCWWLLGIIGLWVTITLVRLAYHQPWYDEAHAYILTQNLSILELVAEMKSEGHLLVWYLLIMPFAKLKLWYPYPMQIINWLCAFGTILIIWKKAPFHPITKTIVTFSYPFICCLPVLARCYAVGVLLIFMIASLYYKSLKHPIIYSVLILLCANTSIMALFGAAAFGFVFAYDLIKAALKDEISKKNFRIAFLVLAASAILVLWQIGGTVNSVAEYNHDFIHSFLQVVFGYDYYYAKSKLIVFVFFSIIALTILYTPIILFKKNKKVLFIWIFALTSMIFCFVTKYTGDSWHYIFFWVYAMVCYWMLIDSEKSKTKLMIVSEIVLVLFFSIQLVSRADKFSNVYFSNSKNTYNKLVSNIKPNSRIIITKHRMFESVVPYFENNNIEIYSYKNAQPFVNGSFIYDELISDTDNNLYLSWLVKSIADNKENYIIMLSSDDRLVVKNKYHSISLEKIVNLNSNISLYYIIKN